MMKKTTWKLKEAYRNIDPELMDKCYSDYQFGWLRVSRLFPTAGHQFGFHLDIPGKNYSILNFKRIEWKSVFTANKRFYLRIDLYFGGWFITVKRQDMDHYKSVDIVSITDFFGKECSR